MGDDAAGDDSDEDFDVKGVLDEDNKDTKHAYYPFFYSMTRRYQKKKGEYCIIPSFNHCKSIPSMFC